MKDAGMPLQTGLLALLICGVSVSAWPVPQEPGRKQTLSELAWLAGGWEGDHGKARIEERWTAPAGKTMLGLNRTISGDRTVAFEFLRIEERADGIYYVAHPNARSPGTDFKLTRLDPSEVVFENPQHDHPQMIRYKRNPDGTLTVRIEGDSKGQRAPLEFRFEREKN